MRRDCFKSVSWTTESSLVNFQEPEFPLPVIFVYIITESSSCSVIGLAVNVRNADHPPSLGDRLRPCSKQLTGSLSVPYSMLHMHDLRTQ